MKPSKPITIVLLLCLSKFGYSQFIVSDPSLTAIVTQMQAQLVTNQSSNIVEYANQTSTLKTTLKFMKDATKKLNQVNAKISEGIYYTELVKTQLRIVKFQIEYLGEIKSDKHITPQEALEISQIFGDMLIRSESLLGLTSQLLEAFNFEMGDSQRLENLKQLNTEMTAILREVVVLQQHYNYVRKERALAKIIEQF